MKQFLYKAGSYVLQAIGKWTDFTGYVCAIGIVVSSIIITYEVIVRYIFVVPTVWEIELSVYLLIMATFVGGAYAVKHEGHIAVELVTSHLPLKKQEILVITTSVIALIIAIIICWYSWPMWWQAVIKHQHSESLWAPSLFFPYILLPIGMLFTALAYVEYIPRKIAQIRASRQAEKHNNETVEDK
ncbi:MAG: TRAP transporter small permease [Dehalococcoidia bacterium]|nr:TRAP transporter small permease [Dehalococcoidia bacterium]